jgi:hypothetical protein
MEEEPVMELGSCIEEEEGSCMEPEVMEGMRSSSNAWGIADNNEEEDVTERMLMERMMMA